MRLSERFASAVLLLGLFVAPLAEAAKPTDGATVLLQACSVARREALTKNTQEEAATVARADHATEIDKASTFKAFGMTQAGAEAYLGTPPGQKLLADLAAADPASPPDTIRARALDQLGTGLDSPKQATQSGWLVKIVPHGQTVSPYSPYFATVAAMKAACASPRHLADTFALPLKSEADTYDLYEIKPAKERADSFVSVVAPSSELNGLALRPGGALQSLVPNRGDWSQPILLGTVGR